MRLHAAGKFFRKLAPCMPKVRPDGYVNIGHRLLHRMVAACWLENPNNAKLVHHKNGIKSDNGADNLEWVTPSEHMGERHYGACGRYVRTQATRDKLRAFRTGFKDTPAVKQKKREILLRVSIRKRACMIDGIAYRSFLAASKAIGVHFHTIRNRCLSKNFPSYQLI